MAPITPITPSDFGDKARRELLQLLEGVRGKKNLVIEKALAGPIGLCVKFSTLQEYGVDRVFLLENQNVDSSQKNVIFLARGDRPSIVTSVAEQIKKLRYNGEVEHDFSVLWVPRRTLVSDQILEEAGVLGEVNINEYGLFFVPLAEDVLSLELDSAFADLYLWKDPGAIYTSAKALMLMQQKHGLFPRITGKGDNAKRLADLLLRMQKELDAGSEAGSGSSNIDLAPSQSIESLIIIDREVDFPTVLMTQLTYEGLLDEIFTVDSNQVEVDSTLLGNTPTQAGSSSTATTQSTKRKVLLDGSDQLYAQLRDSNCAIVGPTLNKIAKKLQSTYDSRSTAKTTAELREFVSKLPGYQAEQASLKLHTGLAEEVIKRTRVETFSRLLEVQQNIAAGADPSTQHESIEELIARDVPLVSVLKLLCIESTFGNGIRTRDLETFKRAIIQGYGYQQLLTLSSLEKIGLLIPRIGSGLVGSVSGPKTTNYTAVRKSLHLIVDEVNEAEPEDIAYVYSGYAPLSVRLVQCVLQKHYLSTLTTKRGTDTPATAASSATQGWRPFEDVLKQIRGATFDESQVGEDKAIRARQILNGSTNADSGKTVVVFFLGGVCRAEIAALRFVAKQLKEEGKGRRLLICTTGILTGDRMVGSAIETRSFAV